MDLAVGLRARARHVVSEPDTASALGSGDVPVLATPQLLAWAEAATVAAVDGRLELGATSVGTHVTLEHLAPTPVGAAVEVGAELVRVDGTLLHFAVTARQDGREIARGEVSRAIVERGRFLARAHRHE